MSGARTTRTGLVISSLAFTLSVGVIAVLDSSPPGTSGPSLPVVWWSAYVAFCATQLAVQGYLPALRRLNRTLLLVTLLLLGAVLVLLYFRQGSAALLFVMTATMASFFWPPRAVAAVIATQTAVVGATGVLGAWPTVDLVVGVTVFGISQVFGALVVFTARSETEARRELALAHAELRSTTALLQVSTREAERLRISRDLHDLAGHHLTALSLELEVASHLALPGHGGEHVARARAIAKDLLETVRTAVSEMRVESPPLAPALDELANGIPSLDVSVEVRGELHLAVEPTVAILRCVQEAVTNTLRHTDARSVRILVEDTGCEVRVTISDDGEGTARIVPGHGLTGMHERLEPLGGSVELSSSPGAGFTVRATVPRR